MAVDQAIEFFALELFNRLWLDYGLIDEATISPHGIAFKSFLTEDIVRAVKVRQVLFRSSYQSLFHSQGYFEMNATDFYDYLVENFHRSGFANATTMEKVLTVCAFVAEMCHYNVSQHFEFIIPFSYLICAMYIDLELKSDFYAEGGWWSLIKACQSYNAPFAFIKQHSSTINCEYGKNSICFSVSDCKRSIESYKRFTESLPNGEEEPNLYPSFTLLWVDYCIKDLEERVTQTKNSTTFKKLRIKDAVEVLSKLKFYCDPSGSSVQVFNAIADFATRSGNDPNKLLTAFVQYRPFERIAGLRVPEAEILALENRVIDLIQPFTSLGNKNRGCDSQNYDEVLALFSELHSKKNGTVWTKSNEKVLNKFSKLYSCPINDSRVLVRSLDDGATHFSRPDSAKENSVGNENFPTNIKIPEVFSLKSAFEGKKDNDPVTDFLSQLDLNSTKGIENSPNLSRSSDMKKRRSGGKENSPNIQTSDKTQSPKTASTLESYKNKKDKDQITGLLSQLDINSISLDDFKTSPGHPRSSGVKKRISGGKENSPSNAQTSRNITPRKSLSGGKENSPSNVQTSRNITPRKSLSGGKENSPSNVQTSRNITPRKILSQSPSTCISPKNSQSLDSIKKESAVEEICLRLRKNEELLRRNEVSPNTKIQKHKDQIKSGPNASFTANPQDQSLSTSMPAKSEKEKVTDEAKNGVSFADLYSPEYPTDYPSISVLNNTVLDECKATNETGHYDLTTVKKDSSPFLDASMKKSTDQKTVTKDHPRTTSTDASSQSSSKALDAASVTELESTEDCLETTCSETSSQNPSGIQLPKTSNVSVDKKKSKTSRESPGSFTRRHKLLETEEFAQDILRMIHVLGDRISLEFMKSTLKSNREKKGK